MLQSNRVFGSKIFYTLLCCLWALSATASTRKAKRPLKRHAVPAPKKKSFPDLARIAVGGYASCLARQGTLFCWGDYEMRGNGKESSELGAAMPVRVRGFEKDVTQVAIGPTTACAMRNKQLVCWGKLGPRRANVPASSPVIVKNIGAEIQKIVLGLSHSCVAENGGIKCWGDNSHGELGREGGYAPEPDWVAGLGANSGVTDVAVGSQHTCALAKGKVYCWGSNHYGQLGCEITDTHDTCTQHLLALPSGAKPLTGEKISRPIEVPFAPALVQKAKIGSIAAVDSRSCATVDGAVYCWGIWTKGNFVKEDVLFNSSTPTLVAGWEHGVSQAALFSSIDCAVVSQGVQCRSPEMQTAPTVGSGLLDGSRSSLTTPKWIKGFEAGSGVTQVGVSEHICAYRKSEVWCWGFGEYGQVGSGVKGVLHPVNAFLPGIKAPDPVANSSALPAPVSAPPPAPSPPEQAAAPAETHHAAVYFSEVTLVAVENEGAKKRVHITGTGQDGYSKAAPTNREAYFYLSDELSSICYSAAQEAARSMGKVKVGMYSQSPAQPDSPNLVEPLESCTLNPIEDPAMSQREGQAPSVEGKLTTFYLNKLYGIQFDRRSITFSGSGKKDLLISLSFSKAENADRSHALPRSYFRCLHKMLHAAATQQSDQLVVIVPTKAIKSLPGDSVQSVAPLPESLGEGLKCSPNGATKWYSPEFLKDDLEDLFVKFSRK